MKISRIVTLVLLFSAAPVFAGEFGLRFGYWDIQEGAFNLDLQQRIAADDAITGKSGRATTSDQSD